MCNLDRRLPVNERAAEAYASAARSFPRCTSCWGQRVSIYQDCTFLWEVCPISSGGTLPRGRVLLWRLRSSLGLFLGGLIVVGKEEEGWDGAAEGGSGGGGGGGRGTGKKK